MTVDNPAVEASHAHWDMFDMSFEGSRYAALQAVLGETNINVAAAEALREEIIQFSDLTGYGDADGFYAATLTFIRELQEATRQSYITGRDRKTSEVEALSLTSPTL
jgi:hypothetical protein